MSTIRKYRPAAKQNKKPLFTIDRALLAGFVGITGLGLAQPSIMSFAFSDKTPATTMTAQSKPTVVAAKPAADYTPVGSIERKPVEALKPVEAKPANPHGLRLER